MIEKEKPDIAFLDWQMPELDGMGVVRQLRKQSMPLIAFVTAYDEYAVRAFEVNAVDYLLKPVDKSRLRETLNRAQDRMEHEEIVPRSVRPLLLPSSSGFRSATAKRSSSCPCNRSHRSLRTASCST